ncbi:MAG: hypothetical protein K2P81_13395 [Bacteriovoracaceae bacterium]|nr:hypothetical protein [Bacteriovoracaceae bacterium]
MISNISMTPGTKRSNERGQISIFFASSLIVLISIIAFVINIGLFVKAKINLQNATDAGAYAGAAVQARMLNRIGYMNWEMRNVYKEWMFKYWVLGNLNIGNVETNPGGGNMSFRMEKDPNISGVEGEDPYNLPSVCLHYAGVPTNVCRRYALPGIPRFEPTSLVGIDETTSSFLDAIVKEKSSDCSKRTQLNYNVTNMWAYNLTGGSANNAFQDAPQIAADRPGAWPKAVELAIRTRSLEYAMNRPPITEGVCSPNGQGSSGCRSVMDLVTENHYGNERPSKAFWSAYRNIGNEFDNEMKATFTLTELPPTPYEITNPKSISAVLIGGKATQQGNITKHYLDLQIMMVNYATFFTALIARDDKYAVGGQLVKSEGACDVSKIAIPIPGYPVGFFKNPDVVTFYAVKGEAKFQGLFNPFKDKVKLTAWAAAKPMGGRIGPALFRQNQETLLASRTTANKKRSVPYLSGLKLDGAKIKGTNTPVTPGKYYPGMPVPINVPGGVSNRFWITDATDPVGGWVSGSDVVFGVPNLVYDFDNQSLDPTSYQVGTSDTNIVVPGNAGVDSGFASGLYKVSQFWKFRENLQGTNDPSEINKSISHVRSPTSYEAANYTVPFPSSLGVTDQVNAGYIDTFGFITGVKDQDDVQASPIYAPLYGDSLDAMYSNGPDVVNGIKEFILLQEGAMKKYRTSMNQVAASIYQADPVKYLAAAKRISNFDFALQPDNANAKPADCNSITGSFLYFYFGPGGSLGPLQPTGCPEPLTTSIENYFTSTSAIDKSNHLIEYHFKPSNHLQTYDQLLTGYMPGPMRGANQNGQFSTPFPSASEPETMRRTGYSTKLIQLRSLTNSGGYSPGAPSPFAVYSEGLNTPLNEDVKQGSLRNALDLATLGVPATVTY